MSFPFQEFLRAAGDIYAQRFLEAIPGQAVEAGLAEARRRKQAVAPPAREAALDEEELGRWMSLHLLATREAMRLRGVNSPTVRHKSLRVIATRRGQVAWTEPVPLRGAEAFTTLFAIAEPEYDYALAPDEEAPARGRTFSRGQLLEVYDIVARHSERVLLGRP